MPDVGEVFAERNRVLLRGGALQSRATMMQAGKKIEDSTERTKVRCAKGHVVCAGKNIFFIDASMEKVVELEKQIESSPEGKYAGSYKVFHLLKTRSAARRRASRSVPTC
ncbi:hypothetical protein ABZY19_29180 [Streptomyces sp. NPDC006475]|uniref:hypothetical protein n=1 Tax=Streptomyces sp. NPDC006475 TaxID=3155719 RepID=UPI0033A70B41